MPEARFRMLGPRDLEAINRVISDAVLAWPLPERTRRLALPVLRYDKVDLEHFEAIGAYALNGRALPAGLYGIAIWDAHQLHGLYVTPAAQGRGLGRSLLDRVLERASQAGIARLLVKAERVSASYFEQLGLPPAGTDSPYPYAFHLHTGAAISRPSRADQAAGLLSLR